MTESFREGEVFRGLPKALEAEVESLIKEQLGLGEMPAFIVEDSTYFDVSDTSFAALDSGKQDVLLNEIRQIVGEGYDVGVGSRVTDEDEDETLIFITKVAD